jgi:hypothetical protein
MYVLIELLVARSSKARAVVEALCRPANDCANADLKFPGWRSRDLSRANQSDLPPNHFFGLLLSLLVSSAVAVLD